MASDQRANPQLPSSGRLGRVGGRADAATLRPLTGAVGAVAEAGIGLGFADQLGDAVRARSRKADRRLERAADRLARRHPPESPQRPPHGDEDDGHPAPVS
jgi:hypothetical protein